MKAEKMTQMFRQLASCGGFDRVTSSVYVIHAALLLATYMYM